MRVDALKTPTRSTTSLTHCFAFATPRRSTPICPTIEPTRSNPRSGSTIRRRTAWRFTTPSSGRACPCCVANTSRERRSWAWSRCDRGIFRSTRAGVRRCGRRNRLTHWWRRVPTCSPGWTRRWTISFARWRGGGRWIWRAARAKRRAATRRRTTNRAGLSSS